MPGTVAPEISSTSSFRSGSSSRGISIGPSTLGPNVMSRSLSRSESRPGTQSSRSQSDSMRGSRGGRPNLRVKRSRRAEPHPRDKGRVIRSGRGSAASRSIDSQPLRRRIKCSGTRDHPRQGLAQAGHDHASEPHPLHGDRGRGQLENQNRFAMVFIPRTHYSRVLPELTYFPAVVCGTCVAGSGRSPQGVPWPASFLVSWRIAVEPASVPSARESTADRPNRSGIPGLLHRR
jgi:hypothetical protein